MYAAAKGRLYVYQYLKDKGASFNIISDKRECALILAINGGHIKIANDILERCDP